MNVNFAMLSYHDVHGRLPPAAVCGADGTPLLSWRVLVLPYIEEQHLFDEFRLDEPWDSPHNVRLLPKMPEAYKARPRTARQLPADHTVLHVFVGAGAAFDFCYGYRLDDFSHGRHNTIFIVEGGKPVPWTKPEEIDYDPYSPLPDLFNVFGDMVRVGWADGSVRRLSRRVSEARWRAAITNSKDEWGPDWSE